MARKGKPGEHISKWLDSCLRAGRLSRNTIAVGLVIVDALRRKCPLGRQDIISKGGEIKGARSGLARVLTKYGIAGFLKEVTTRQAHQDGQRLLETLEFGQVFPSDVSERDALLTDLAGALVAQAASWLARRHMRVACSRDLSPTAWVSAILEQSRDRSGGRVEQHLVGAKLARAFPDITIPAHPGAAADTQTGRAGDFQVGTTVYHVTAVPGESIIQKCSMNVAAGLHPVILAPARVRSGAEYIVTQSAVAGRITVIAIEDFLAVNILEMSRGERGSFVETLAAILSEYNRRVAEAETDLSLRIEID